MVDIVQDFMFGKVLRPEGNKFDWNIVSGFLVFYRDGIVVIRK